MLDTTPKRRAGTYAAPAIALKGNLVALTREPWATGENDNGMPPEDCFEPAGSVGFLL